MKSIKSKKLYAKPKVRSKSLGNESAASGPGTLIIIGGSEEKQGKCTILTEVVKKSQGKRIVVISAASEIPKEVWQTYLQTFTDLGASEVVHLMIENSMDSRKKENMELLDGAGCVFFTGGDQLKITTKIGGTPLFDRIYEIFQSGGTIAGTSAGASVMGETMLVGGEGRESHKVGNWLMSSGLGFVHNTLIDQHFAQRGRLGRLLGAVALNPAVLGLGIDEDTAIILSGSHMQVIGSNAVYVVDGSKITYTNISEHSINETLSLHNACLHVFGAGGRYDLKSRKAIT